MPRRYWWYVLAFVLALILAAIGMYVQAHAQDCATARTDEGEFSVCYATFTPTPAAPTATETPEPELTATATETDTPQPTETATSTATATATETATPVPPTSTATATATAQPTNTATNTPQPPPAADLLRGVAVLGDSFYDEYRANDNRGGAYAATTFNNVELMVKLRGLNVGPWGVWGEPRRTGYEYNWARSGATSATMIQQNQHVKAAQQVRDGKVTFVFIGIGANDFSPGFNNNYQNIYNGTLSGAALQAKVNQAISDVTLAVDTVQQAGAQGVAVVLFTQWESDPTIASRFPDATKRKRVADAIDAVNAGLRGMAQARPNVAIVDQNAFGAAKILPYLDSAGNFAVGGEKISLVVNGDEPHHAKLGDGSHVGTVMSGMIANYYWVDMLAGFGVNIPPLTDAEILGAAGIRAGPTPAPTATATQTVAPTSTPTAQPTNTPEPSVTPVTAAALRVNVPLIDAPAGDPALDANNWSILWTGEMSPAGNYAQARLAGSTDGLRAYVQFMAPSLAGGRFTVTLRGRTYTITPSSAAGWTVGARCGSGGCRGWSASRVIPWAELGGKPSAGEEWPLVFSTPKGEWRGVLHWGLPDYGGRAVQGAQVLTLPLSADASLGGGTDCAADDDPNNGRVSSFFAEWGSNNVGISGSKLISLGSIAYANVQAQWDTADWPCYARYLTKWRLPSLPDGAQVVSATLSLYKFGHSGYAGEPTGTNVMQVWEASPDWTEAGVSWDNGPAVWENVSRLPVGECSAANCATGEWHAFDVTEIVRRALGRGDAEAAALLYTAAGQYHSGRYFYTREGAVKPVVRISYIMEGTPAWTPTAEPSEATAEPSPSETATSAPSATPTATPTAAPPTALPTATPSPLPPTSTATATPTSTPTSTVVPAPGGIGCTRYVSPGGLAAALYTAQPGNVLCLNDGVYLEAFVPTRDGTASAPITVKAVNDGKAIIDGQGVRKTVDLQRSYYVIEGLVARNGTDNVFRVDGSNNVLRRVSAYNASTDINSAVIMLLGNNNLVEDAIVAGTGRYMAEVYKGGGNTLRRVFTMWEGWDGRQFCGVAWPNGNNIGVYNASDTTVENAIAYGRSLKGIMVQANSDSSVADNNYVLGSIAVLQGRNYDGSVWNYGSYPTRPGPTTCTSVDELGAGGDRVGFILFGQGTITNNVFRDVLAVDNVGAGFDAHRPYTAGTVGGNLLERATLAGNGAQLPTSQRGQGGNMYISLPGVEVRDSRIPNAPAQLAQGQGAILQRYVGRQATGQPMTPWPMEGRALSELGISINAIIEEYAGR